VFCAAAVAFVKVVVYGRAIIRRILRVATRSTTFFAAATTLFGVFFAAGDMRAATLGLWSGTGFAR
jgi:hypothetical protein